MWESLKELTVTNFGYLIRIKQWLGEIDQAFPPMKYLAIGGAIIGLVKFIVWLKKYR